MYVIGTAGHVDHGKSTLVQALTGIDPDRLKAEKERGMTIDLGFAWTTTPNGREISIIDVPGHENFIKNMLAGVGNIDLALLVVAADDSIMPQTMEHLSILDMMQVKNGLTVISKKDLVEEEILELVESEVKDLLKGTMMEHSPIAQVSSVTGDGMDRLLQIIDQVLQDTDTRQDFGRPRLSIDRAFTLTGFGTVITGTLIDGSIEIGMDLEILPSGKTARIRGIQTHRRKVDKVGPGRRVAVNLAGIEHESISRGEVATTPGWLKPSIALDVNLQILKDSWALKHNNTVSFYTGSKETTARVRMLDANEAQPGHHTWAQMKLQEQIALVRGDKFVIRHMNRTVGGGTIVDTHPVRHRRNHPPVIRKLEIMNQGDQQDILVELLETSGPCSATALSDIANSSIEETKSLIESLKETSRIIQVGSDLSDTSVLLYSAGRWQAMVSKTQSIVGNYHEENKLRKGIPKEELRSKLGIQPREFTIAFQRMQDDCLLAEEMNLVCLPGHQVCLSESQRATADTYIRDLRRAGYSPPTDSHMDSEILTMLLESGDVIRVGEKLIYDKHHYEAMVDITIKTIQTSGSTNVAKLRDQFKTSRKYAVSFLEHLDQIHVTRRVGDDRVLR